MKLGLILRHLVIVVTCGSAVTAQAATAWNEASNGALSNDGLSPAPLVMTVGSNRVFGFTGNSGQGIDRDYFTFSVPAGASLIAIMLLDNTSVS